MAQKIQNIGNDLAKCRIHTKTDTKMVDIRSTIENVSKLPCETKISGPDFCLTPDCMCCVSFKKDEKDLFLYIQNKSAAVICIGVTIVLHDCNNKILYEDNDGYSLSLKKLQEKDLLESVDNRSDFDSLTNDTLIIDISVTIKSERKEVSSLVKTDSKSKLRKDFKTMLENPINSDVCLQVGEERISAHWAVLCSRSPYFKRMFESEMRERVQNSVTVTDIPVSALRHLIEFLYTASFFETDHSCEMEELFDLYYAADKYEVMDLRTLCASKMITYASTDNVWQIFQLAHRHSDKDLKMEAMSFIQLYSDAAFQTDGWKKFEVSEPLAAEVFSFSFKKK